ncbi:MAG TPA: sodium:alanine symporter family protein [Candidatus Blautia pullicola]|uniref:Sodium:alanine symporter family protein n=1 Tax=Candidatus Blautia pullicola TaxID=2838498 RepID=A0A9D2JRI9_9FIRM|nr:sodium:alanine symporter family protein [Candidatus Blautia pullicola]
MNGLLTILQKVQEIVWGPPTMLLLLATGFYFTLKLKGIQMTRLGLAIRYIFEKEEGEGDVSAFASLCTALAATIGTGSIVGVATALRAGGPGALFWMWVSAFVGMATKYAEGVLAVKYRSTDEKGQICGGPMYYIQNGMGDRWKWLAKLFAFFGIMTAMLGCGTFPQVNAITESTSEAFGLPVWFIGIVVAVAVACVVLGGIQSISNTAQFVVPFMAMLYIAGSLVILLLNFSALPEAFHLIITSAFTPQGVGGGAAGTAFISVMTSMRTGIARGVYTNEAGLGSSPIVVAAAKTKSCVRQGLVSMTSVFFTTIIICTMTGLVVITSGLLESTDLDGGRLSNAAYNLSLPHNMGMYMVSVGLIFFAFTTIISWCYYGERCLVYLSKGVKWILPYKICYIACVALAPYLELQPIWLMADITNACMAFPNLIGLLGLSGVVISETKVYFEGFASGKKG